MKSEVEAIRSFGGTSRHREPFAAYRHWPIGTVLAALLAFAASFMPWGNMGIALSVIGPDELRVSGDTELTGWNSNLTLGRVAIPNWTLGIVALIVAGLAVLQAATTYSTRHFVLALAVLGIAQAGMMSWLLSTRGQMGIGAPTTLAAFAVIFLANTVPAAAKYFTSVAAERSAAARRLAKVTSIVALIGNSMTAGLAYSATPFVAFGRVFPAWPALAAALSVGLAIGSLFFFAVLFSKRMQHWASPIAEAISPRLHSPRVGLRLPGH